MNGTATKIRSIVEEKIPVGMVVPEHTEDKHRYRYLENYELYDSVTTKTGILDAPHLKKWAAGMATKYIDRKLEPVVLKTGDQAHVLYGDKDSTLRAAQFAHRDVFEDAGQIGTEGHDIVERYINRWIKTGRRPSDITKLITGEDSRLWAITRSAEQFMSDYDVIPIVSEKKIVSVKYGFGGTMDFLALVPRDTKEGNGACVAGTHSWQMYTNPKRIFDEHCFECGATRTLDLCVIDWKTSNSIFKAEYAMQVSAYNYGFREMTDLKPKRILIVRLDKTRMKYEVAEINKAWDAFRAFQNISNVYDWLEDPDSKPSPLSQKKVINVFN